jgi:AraC-like DNA-binding protein
MSEDKHTPPIVWSMSTSGITAKRMRFSSADATPLSVGAIEDAYLVSVQLHAAAGVQIWRRDDLLFDGTVEPGAVTVFDLSHPWRRRYLSGFDCLSFHIPFDILSRASASLGYAGLPELSPAIGASDPVLMSLSLSLLPALENPAAANRSFLTQVHNAILSHLLHAYALSDRTAPGRGMLSPRQEEMAKEFMRANFNRSISLEETAQSCGLSRSHFIRAFRQTTGVTPHRWLLDYRIDRVKDLLSSEMTIAEIASACGFADQSHMSRVFQKRVGATPTAWRRRSTRPPR